MALCKSFNSVVELMTAIELVNKPAPITASKHRVLIRDSTHKISFWLADGPERVELLADAVDRFDFSAFEPPSQSL